LVTSFIVYVEAPYDLSVTISFALSSINVEKFKSQVPIDNDELYPCEVNPFNSNVPATITGDAVLPTEPNLT
jgi:hypothetical protein